MLEGRRSIQLSYGRASYVDSKSFIAKKSTILAHLPSAERADALGNWATGTSSPTQLILLKLQNQFDVEFCRNRGATWSKRNGKRILGGIEKLAPHDLREHVEGFAMPQEVSWSSSFSLAMLRSSPVGENEISSRVVAISSLRTPFLDSFCGVDHTSNGRVTS